MDHSMGVDIGGTNESYEYGGPDRNMRLSEGCFFWLVILEILYFL